MIPANRATSVWVLILLGLVAPAANAQDQKKIDQAIQAGVASLKQQQGADGSWLYVMGNGHTTGATALAALTLVECDVPPEDPIIQRAALIVRKRAAIEPNTYDIALAIMFLDRLGKGEDEALIGRLTSSLLKGQTAAGGWSYICPVEGVSAPAGPGAGVPGAPAVPVPRAPAAAPPGFGPVAPPAPQLLKGGPGGLGDNSNTQFATLALWVSRRHKLAADQALEGVGQRFRATQHADGGWSYQPTAYQATTPTMTCAGLLGMAVSYGVAEEAVLRTQAERGPQASRRASLPRDPNRDPAVRLGLLALGQLLAGPYALAQKSPGVVAGPVPGPPAGQAPGLLQANLAAGTDYYLLWSVERVAMAFGLRTIARLDWYAWGSRVALATQRPDGSWQGSYGPVIDTSFALLFLRRSNLVKDLSDDLKDLVRDPAEARLRAGGVGGKGLQGQEGSLDPGAVGKADAKKRPTRRSSVPELRPEAGADAPGAGKSSAGTASLDPEAARLSAAVVGATGAEQEALIDQLRDARGVIHTEALAAAIPQLSGPARTRARDALAERLTRMTAATIRQELQDQDLEIRRAAALASAMKGEQSFIPDLIAMLDDPEPPVVRAAHAALKALSKEDFGPAADASRAERTEAINKWKAWWAASKKR
jgi:hypothetical protein